MTVIIIRIIYIGFKNGCIVEFFKVLAVVFSIFIGLHYYSGISVFLQDKFNLSRGFFDFLSIALLWGLTSLVFRLLRDGLMLIFRVEAQATLDKWGGLLLSIVRGALVCSLIFVMVGLSGSKYLQSNAQRSIIHPYVESFAPNLYRASFTGIISNFFPNEELNGEVFKPKKADEKGSKEK